MPRSSAAPIHVAVGIIINERREVLISRRPAASHQGGLWEFPGGKLEAGESVEQGLRREFREELGIEPRHCFPLRRIPWDYGDKAVLLDVWRINEFSGQLRGLEGQPWEWRPLPDLHPRDFPAANASIIRTIQLPQEIAITPELGSERELERLLDHLLSLDMTLIQFRQPGLDPPTFLRWFKTAQGLCAGTPLVLMLNQSLELFRQAAATGYHANSRRLAELTARPVPAQVPFSASCHNLAEMHQAQAVDADFIYLSPLRAGGKVAPGGELGWQRFAQLARQISLPVYALGGLGPADLPVALEHGAFGIAGIGAYRP